MGKNFLSKMFQPVHSAGKWVGHAASDTLHWGEKTVGKVGNKLLNFTDKQLGRGENILTNPTLLIVVGVVVVALVVLK